MQFSLETCGWIGSILFAICGLPQAITCYRSGNANGINWFFLLAWLFGEIFTLIYIWPKSDLPLITNYVMNLVFVLVIFRYKAWPRTENLLSSPKELKRDYLITLKAPL